MKKLIILNIRKKGIIHEKLEKENIKNMFNYLFILVTFR